MGNQSDFTCLFVCLFIHDQTLFSIFKNTHKAEYIILEVVQLTMPLLLTQGFFKMCVCVCVCVCARACMRTCVRSCVSFICIVQCN